MKLGTDRLRKFVKTDKGRTFMWGTLLGFMMGILWKMLVIMAMVVSIAWIAITLKKGGLDGLKKKVKI